MKGGTKPGLARTVGSGRNLQGKDLAGGPDGTLGNRGLRATLAGAEVTDSGRSVVPASWPACPGAGVVALAILWTLGCTGGITNRVAIDSEDSLADTTTGSKDLQVVCQQMVRSMVGLPRLSRRGPTPRIAILQVENRTNEILDTRLFTTKMRTQLIKFAAGRVVFVDRSTMSAAAVAAERQAKREGVVGSSGAKELSGADYFLTGELGSIDKTVGGTRSTYTRYSFRLTDAESSDILWEDEYEVKKVAHRGVWDQ